MDSSKNRKRTHNFDVEETEFLLECISECADIIENKTNESKSVNVKHSAWDAIGEAFKSSPNLEKRSKEQLYDKWRNLKAYTSRDPSCLIAQLEYQVRDLESQLSYGWQAYEQQAAQISALAAENLSLKEENVEKSRNLDDLVEENQKVKSENDKLVHIIDARSTGIKNLQNSTSHHDDEPDDELNNVKTDYIKVLQDLDSVRKEHEDLLLLLADQ
uniref:Regulatory protein zeste n=1 Tax=Romanomermis culicivorax TaxID=13658 RepID=A0A915L6E2_ROMCU